MTWNTIKSIILLDNRRTKPPLTSYGEQRRHDIEHSYKDLLRELTNPSERVFDAAAEFRKRAQSALTEGAQDCRRRLLPRIPDRPLHRNLLNSDNPFQRREQRVLLGPRHPGADHSRRRSARNELRTLLSPVKTGKKGKKQKKKATEKTVVVTRQYWRL